MTWKLLHVVLHVHVDVFYDLKRYYYYYIIFYILNCVTMIHGILKNNFHSLYIMQYY